ncbi:MAG: dTMP kinase [Rhodobacteraceae bacterium]|nr:dTMP kinase [Paracoccaceae bacterium]
MSNAGYFITFEGGEGAGKSTQVRLLAAALERKGREVLLTREPGGSPGAEEIRKLLVEGDAGKWDGWTEALLHYAARRDHVERTISPALAAGKIVISDRFADSTMAYQGFGHGLDRARIRELHQIALGHFVPDLTLIFDLPVAVGLARAKSRGGAETRYETMRLEFHERLREGFLAIARENPNRCKVIDATGSVEEIHARIVKAVDNALQTV